MKVSFVLPLISVCLLESYSTSLGISQSQTVSENIIFLAQTLLFLLWVRSGNGDLVRLRIGVEPPEKKMASMAFQPERLT